MPLRAAFQMDPLEKINISGDSSFALMVAAQARGHTVYHYLSRGTHLRRRPALRRGAWRSGVQPVPGDDPRLGAFTILDLGADVDVVLMRQDPPFDLGYITATHLLEQIQGETLVVNDPASVRNAPKRSGCSISPQFMPPTAVTRSLGLARKFLAEHGEIVIKPLHGFAGGSVFRVSAGRPQPRFAYRAVQPHLSRAARHPEIPSRGRRGRQADRAGRRRIRRGDQSRPGEGEIAPTSRRRPARRPSSPRARRKSAPSRP